MELFKKRKRQEERTYLEQVIIYISRFVASIHFLCIKDAVMLLYKKTKKKTNNKNLKRFDGVGYQLIKEMNPNSTSFPRLHCYKLFSE